MSSASVIASSTVNCGNGKVGPNLAALERVARQSQLVFSTIEIVLKGSKITLELGVSGVGSWPGNWAYLWGRELGAQSVVLDPSRLGDTLLVALKKYDGAAFDLTTISIKSKLCPLSNKELASIILGAWCEAAGVDIPSADSLRAGKDARKMESQTSRAFAVDEMRKDISWWNNKGPKERLEYLDFRKADFSNAALDHANFSIRGAGPVLNSRINFQSANFSNAHLSNAKFQNCDLRQASFERAYLCNASIHSSKSANACYAAADLSHCNFHAVANGASFVEANLSNANFAGSDLRGADFSGANLDGVDFGNSAYDEKSKFPKDFVPPPTMRWVGKDYNPWLTKQVEVVTESLDFAAFLDRIKQDTDPVRIKNALSMLKADKFRLFSECQPDCLVGVVKSQSDPDLVYSCFLNTEGKFGCCTQNLNVCGGLRGALCKHLLVLVLGLTNGGSFDATTACNWMLASKLHKPALDKELLTATLLRYKGAEAGEIDWRPSETIPEDFYAY